MTQNPIIGADSPLKKPRTAQERYTLLERLRDPYLIRARDCAALTIPALLPPEGDQSGTRLRTPYQSIGARGVNNLASKLLLTLFPPNTPFFKAMVPDSYVEELTQQLALAQAEGDDGAVGDLSQLATQIEAGLAKIERTVMKEAEAMGSRVHMFLALKHLVVSGNCLVYITKDMKLKVYRLDRFVVQRDPSGNVIEIIVKDTMHPEELPENIRSMLAAKEPDKYGSDKVNSDTKVDFYTRIYRDGGWRAFSEVLGEKIEGTDTTYPDKAFPWIVLRMSAVDGESYGRSHVEEHLGDLNSLERLMKAIIEAAAIAAKVIFLINPNGVTKASTLAKTKNGGFASGNADDVTTLAIEKMQEFSFVRSTADILETRLSFAFLLNTAIQRKGERVTAEEIRFMAGELEDALGGVYSVLSQDLQLPFVNTLFGALEARGEIPPLPDDIDLVVTTGLEALGRGHDLNRLRLLVQDLVALGEPAMMRVNMANLIERLATGNGVDPTGLIRSEEEIQAEQQQAQMQAMIESLGPNAINQIGQNAKQAQTDAASAQAPQGNA